MSVHQTRFVVRAGPACKRQKQKRRSRSSSAQRLRTSSLDSASWESRGPFSVRWGRESSFVRPLPIVLQVGAVVVLLAGLLAVIQILKLAFQMQEATATIGGLLLAVLMAAALFGVAQIYLYRAQSIRELEDSPFTVIPILSILFRTTGEAYAVFAVAFGVGGCLFTWLSGMSPRMLLAAMGDFLPPMLGGAGGSSFVDGLMFLVFMVLAAFASLVAFYALAELVIVLVDIAINVRRVANRQTAAAA